MSHWGYHLLLDCAACDLSKVTDPAVIKEFVVQLVTDIDMVAYGEPQIVHFGDGDLSGWTLVQLIETSNITAHFCDNNGDAYIDVFSCKEFDPEIALAVVQKFFSPSNTRKIFLTRQARER